MGDQAGLCKDELSLETSWVLYLKASLHIFADVLEITGFPLCFNSEDFQIAV